MSITLDRVEGEVVAILMAGGMPLGARRYLDGAVWNENEHHATLDAGDIPAALVELARMAVEESEMEFAAVSVIEENDRPALLWFDAGPDLAEWDLSLNGRVAAGFADYLVAIAAGNKEKAS
jgi:glutathione synthase/RimK-type ligase-like ATP-grasp enzyme